MTDEIAANVLMQDGPEPEEIELPSVDESTPAEPAAAGGEGDPAPAKDGDPKPEESEHKRLGGWQRKIQRLEQEKETLLEALKRNAPAEVKAPPPDERPKPPKLLDWAGTAEEFDRAVEEFPAKLEKYLDSKRETEATQRQTQSALESLNTRVGELPELKEMRAASKNVPARLMQFVFQQASTLKNGAEVIREAVLDPDNRDQLLEFDKQRNGQGIASYLSAISHGLRIAAKKSQPADVEPAQTRAPAPPKPVNRAVSTDHAELRDDLPADEWNKRFLKRLEKR